MESNYHLRDNALSAKVFALHRVGSKDISVPSVLAENVLFVYCSWFVQGTQDLR